MIEIFSPPVDDFKRGRVKWVEIVGGIGIGRIQDLRDRTLHTFVFRAILGYNNETLKQMGLRKGRLVKYVDDEYGCVDYVSFPFIEERRTLFGRWELPS